MGGWEERLQPQEAERQGSVRPHLLGEGWCPHPAPRSSHPSHQGAKLPMASRSENTAKLISFLGPHEALPCLHAFVHAVPFLDALSPTFPA